MKIKYDKIANAIYISIKKEIINKTKKISDYIFIDLNKNNKIIGIEILK